MNEDKIRAELLKSLGYVNSLIGFCQSLKVGTLITNGYVSRMNDHYIPNVQKTCQLIAALLDKSQAALSTRPDVNQSPKNDSDRWQDSELEMMYIDGYHGKEHTNYASSGDPKHIAGLRAIAVKSIWAAANKINGNLCDKVAELEKQIATAFDVNQELVEALLDIQKWIAAKECELSPEENACLQIATTTLESNTALAKHKAGDAGFTEEEIINLITPHTGYYLADKTGLRLAEEMAKPIINDLKAAGVLRLREE